MKEESNLALDVLRQQKEEHAEECDRLHTIITRLIIALCVVSALLVGTICYQIWNSYQPLEDTATEQIQQDNKDGQNNYIGNNGEINNGKTDDNKNKDN